LTEEMAFLAYHLHWPLNQLLDLEHADRRGWVRQVSAINKEVNAGTG
jgi:hypothetical protein